MTRPDRLLSERLVAPVLVRDLEWSPSPGPIEGVPGYTAVRALVRVHGVPVGWATIPAIGGRCEANAVAAALRPLAAAIAAHLVSDALAEPAGWPAEGLLRAAHASWSGPFPLVTVAVCTRDRARSLERCLAGLLSLDYPRLDLLIVDNAPTTEAAEAIVSRHPQVRYVREPRPGLDWARNRAIAAARGEIIAFTDDDVSVDAGWVRALAETFADPEVMAVTGLVVPAELRTPAQVLFEEDGAFGRGFERRHYHVHAEAGERAARFHAGAARFGTGANMAFRRELFELVGPFDPALDAGTATSGGGDLEMFFRTLKEGHTLVYEPAAVVRHWHRSERADLRARARNRGIGFHAYLVRTALAYPDERLMLMRLAQWWWRDRHLRRLLRSFFRPEELPRDLVLAELSGAWTGLVAYAWARRRAARLGGAPLGRSLVRAYPRAGDSGRPPQRVDLSHFAGTLDNPERLARARILVSHRDRALADLEVPLRGRPLSAARLRDEVSRDLARRFARPGGDVRELAGVLDAQFHMPVPDGPLGGPWAPPSDFAVERRA